MAKLLGMGGNITVGAAQYPVQEWSVAVSNDVQDVTDTGTGGWVARLAGVNSADINFTAFWGSAVASLATTFNIGNQVAFTLNIGDDGGTVSGNAIITSLTITNGAKTAVTFQCTAQSNGTITLS